MIKITIKGLKSELEFLQKQHIAANYEPPQLKEFWSKDIRKYLLKEIKTIFRKEGIGRGGKWAPLDENYALRKKRMSSSRSSKILRLTDAYYNAATGGPTLKQTPGQLFEATEQGMILGVDPGYFLSKFGAPYPRYHERGTRYMRARPVYSQLAKLKRLEEDIIDRAKFFFQEQQRKQRHEFYF